MAGGMLFNVSLHRLRETASRPVEAAASGGEILLDAVDTLWKTSLRQKVAAAGIAVVSINAVTLSNPEITGGHSGRVSHSATIEEAVQRLGGPRGWEPGQASIVRERVLSGQLDSVFDVREPTEEGRLRALNDFNNRLVRRTIEAVGNDLRHVARFTEASGLTAGTSAAEAGRLATYTVAGLAILGSWPLKLASLSLRDARRALAESATGAAERGAKAPERRRLR